MRRDQGASSIGEGIASPGNYCSRRKHSVRLLILTLLAEKEKRVSWTAVEVPVTALAKNEFLLQMKDNAAGRLIYYFIAYHYGPFAKEPYDDLQAQQGKGLVRMESDPEEDKTKIILFDPAKAQEALSEIPEDLKSTRQ
ncbi:hypothetical protein [Methylacidimicrobium tartarophylax]|uniref:Uncharacterized protein n=1 Tax=Methylacidimicrobium tartarophylax TaxID=1041768 RepID=A0A5E6MF30_9BACT|nr:hypothetical protein [Methylacidimicrobium tartarophylax]VVM07726.1 hypothetical protein MAMT_01884 [Methylacidimicrobium tartarophylax]